jgi:pyridoxal phosphate enzyme (YggS family)
VDYIHSIDSLRLAEEIETLAGKLGKKVPVLLEVNASEEASKSGVAVGAAVHLAEQIDSMPNLQLVGLMTMAPHGADEKKVRLAFGRTREIFEEMRWHKMGGANLKHLSMGMSNDFELAIAEGSTMVRIGTELFGGKVGDHEEADE